MSMVNSEFANIRKLLKVKLKAQQKGLMWFFVVAVLMFIGNLVPAVISIIQNTEPGVSHHIMTDFSTTFLFGAIIVFTVMMFLYGKTNSTLSVFPQTNTSRFVTSQAMNYILVVYLGLTALAAYLLLYIAIRVVSLFQENVYLALNFDLGFLFAGFFTFIMYTFLIVAVIGLIGTILRKWTYYAAVAFVALISLAIINLGAVIEHAPRMLGFLVMEPSFGLFMLKAVGLWLAITAVSLVINRYTVYHMNQGTGITKKIAFICIAIAVVLIIIVPLVTLRSVGTVEFSTGYTMMDIRKIEDFTDLSFDGAEIIRIDVSHLPRGSNVILSSNINLTVQGGRNMIFIDNSDALNDIQGDTIVIRFRPPFLYANGIELMHYANPRLNVYLDGNTLHIDYNIDTANVVIIPIWGIARQFEAFSDRGLFTAHLLGSSGGGSVFANVFIWVE